ncbi:MAG TPA: ADYC domain-containing protein [Kofleriaceae bacterium]|nr:ADYC domain-containing protein [Kofleriaceae bacterium]
MNKYIAIPSGIAATALVLSIYYESDAAPLRTASQCQISDPTAVYHLLTSDGCHSSSCGGNSPVVNTFEINGLHPDGCLNADHVALDPDSLDLAGTRCASASKKHYLDFAESGGSTDYQLVATPATNEPDNQLCEGADLVGATFMVASEDHKEQHKYVISRMGATAIRDSLQSATVAAAQPAAGSKTRTAYFIAPLARPSQSLCMTAPPESPGDTPTPVLHRSVSVPKWRASSQPTLPDISPETLPFYAIIVPGAVYNRNAVLLPGSMHTLPGHRDGSSGRWFNIACTSDALAQIELDGVLNDPITETTAGSRLPALHMMTARYCGHVSATTRGTPIGWHIAGRSSTTREASPVVEAQWDNDGASCIAHSRLWMLDTMISLPSQLYKLFGSPSSPSYPMEEGEFLEKLCPGKIQRQCPHVESILESHVIFHMHGDPRPYIDTLDPR